MANLYVTEQGAVLRKTGDRLLVTKDKTTLLDVPCHQIDAVLIFGNVHFTTPAVRELFEHGIEMALLSRHGKLLCQLTPPMAKNVSLRLAQYQRSLDPQFRLDLARRIVTAKVQNGLSHVRQHAYNHPDHRVERELGELARQAEQIAAADTIATLMGVEGNAARIYFSAFAKMIRAGFGFPGRRRRPAPDPVNALLSFGYTLLSNEIASLLDGIGFDPHIGFFHRPSYGRPSLAADLIEEFRAPVIDRFTLRLINTRVFTPDDFALHAPSGSMHLRRDSLRKYFTAYEEALGEETTGVVPDGSTPATASRPHPPETPNRVPMTPPGGQPWRGRFRQQAYALSTTLTDGVPYVPFRWEP